MFLRLFFMGQKNLGDLGPGSLAHIIGVGYSTRKYMNRANSSLWPYNAKKG